MNDELGVNRLRCLLVWLAATAAVGAAVVLLPLSPSLDGAFDELLVRLSSWVLLGCAIWFWVVTTVVVVSAVAAPAGAVPPSVRGVPAPVRRLVLAACGVALTSGIAAPALATPGPVPADALDHSGRIVVSGLPYPDRAVQQAPEQAPQQAPKQAPGPATTRPPVDDPPDPGRPAVVVRHGDTLWSLAAACLPADAADREIASAWHDIYSRNRDVIGEDPDLLEPGQRLVLPPSLHLPPEGASS